MRSMITEVYIHNIHDWLHCRTLTRIWRRQSISQRSTRHCLTWPKLYQIIDRGRMKGSAGLSAPWTEPRTCLWSVNNISLTGGGLNHSATKTDDACYTQQKIRLLETSKVRNRYELAMLSIRWACMKRCGGNYWRDGSSSWVSMLNYCDRMIWYERSQVCINYNIQHAIVVFIKCEAYETTVIKYCCYCYLAEFELRLNKYYYYYFSSHLKHSIPASG